MAWNEPGGDKNPWGNRPNGNRPGGNNDGPPDLDEVLNNLKEKFFGGNKGKGSSGGGSGGGSNAGYAPIVLVLLVGFLILAISKSFYTNQEPERGVVLRFGKHVATTGSGLHFKIPWVDTVEKVDVRAIEKKDYSALMLTKDENIVKVELGLQYRVGEQPDDAYRYLFSTRDADLVLQQAARAAIRQVVGEADMDFVLKEGREQIASRTKDILQKLLNDYETGLKLTTVNLQDAQPPDQVQAAFDDAIKAREDKQRKINEAEQHSNRVLPEARGQAARQLQEADAYRESLIAQAEGEAQRFTALLTEYKKAPRVTRDRLYLETVEEALGSVSKVIVDGGGSNNLMYLPLDKLMENQQNVAPDTRSGNGNVQSMDRRAPTQNTKPDINSRSRSRTRDARR